VIFAQDDSNRAQSYLKYSSIGTVLPVKKKPCRVFLIAHTFDMLGKQFGIFKKNFAQGGPIVLGRYGGMDCNNLIINTY